MIENCLIELYSKLKELIDPLNIDLLRRVNWYQAKLIYKEAEK